MEIIPYSLMSIPLISSELSLPVIKWECVTLEELSLSFIKQGIENLEFLTGVKALKKLNIHQCKLNSFSGIPTTIENFTFKISSLIEPPKDSQFDTLRNLKKLKR